MKRLQLAAVCLLLAFLAACSSNSDEQPLFQERPFNEILSQGIDRYLGSFTPMESLTTDGVTNHRFGGGEGPQCLRGTEYTMATRDAGASELLIFLEGGGACWSELCAANEVAVPGMPTDGILDPTLDVNPMRSWNVTYLPYCDGSLFSGDAQRDYTNDGIPEIHRGLRNLSAGLDVAVREFPAPSRIVLAGNSGGGFGTIFALPLVRSLYPDTPIDVLNDSGVGVGRANDPTSQTVLIEDWRSGEFFPPSICPGCFDAGNLVEYFDWQLNQDSNFNLALLSTKQDIVISAFFLMIPGADFEAHMVPALQQVEARHPDRVRSFISNGASHTFLQRDVFQTAGGVTVHDWVSAMLNGESTWQSLLDP